MISNNDNVVKCEHLRSIGGLAWLLPLVDEIITLKRYVNKYKTTILFSDIMKHYINEFEP